MLSRDDSPTKRPVDEAMEKEKERQAKLKEERLVKPPGVSTTGHRLFLMLDKTYALLHSFSSLSLFVFWSKQQLTCLVKPTCPLA